MFGGLEHGLERNKAAFWPEINRQIISSSPQIWKDFSNSLRRTKRQS